MHLPVQKIYSVIYNKHKIKKKIDSKVGSSSQPHSGANLKQKLVELKNTKLMINFEYKWLGK